MGFWEDLDAKLFPKAAPAGQAAPKRGGLRRAKQKYCKSRGCTMPIPLDRIGATRCVGHRYEENENDV